MVVDSITSLCRATAKLFAATAILVVTIAPLLIGLIH